MSVVVCGMGGRGEVWQALAAAAEVTPSGLQATSGLARSVALRLLVLTMHGVPALRCIAHCAVTSLTARL